ncbi:MAG: ECF transporter S component [Sphaerochaetaceae bacterium]
MKRLDAMRIALMAVLTAVVVVFTLLVRIPTPIKGYISLCDVVITFSAYLFGPLVGAITGGLGTGIADLIGGYPQWAPLSFIIHGLQGLLIAVVAKKGLALAADARLGRLGFGRHSGHDCDDRWLLPSRRSSVWL